jgi:ribulose-5-phosphate 4-epimerase/fuculose-1-phosphate aldolase
MDVTAIAKKRRNEGGIVPENLTDLIAELALANRILAHEGVLDAFGHVSVRHPSDPGRYLLSRSRSPLLIEPGDILEYTLDSAPVRPPKVHLYAERVIHGCIYQARSDVMAVCHHHAPAVMPFCIAGKPIVPVFHLGAAMGEEAPFWDQHDEFGDTNLLVVKPEEGRSLARTLGRHAAVLMNRRRIEGAGRALDLHVPERRVSDARARARRGDAAAPRRDKTRRRHQRDAERGEPDLGILEPAACCGRRPAAAPERQEVRTAPRQSDVSTLKAFGAVTPKASIFIAAALFQQAATRPVTFGLTCTDRRGSRLRERSRPRNCSDRSSGRG